MNDGILKIYPVPTFIRSNMNNLTWVWYRKQMITVISAAHSRQGKMSGLVASIAHELGKGLYILTKSRSADVCYYG